MKITCLNLMLVNYMKKKLNNGGGSKEGSGTFMSNTIVKELKISDELGRVVTTLNIIKH